MQLPHGPAFLISWVSSSLVRILPQAKPMVSSQRPGSQPSLIRSLLAGGCSELQSVLLAISKVPFLSIGSCFVRSPARCSHWQGEGWFYPHLSQEGRLWGGGGEEQGLLGRLLCQLSHLVQCEGCWRSAQGVAQGFHIAVLRSCANEALAAPRSQPLSVPRRPGSARMP